MCLNVVEWVFSGIGTQLLYCLLSFIVGGVIGYKIGIHVKIKQSQKAGDHSNQIQIGNTNKINGPK